MGHGRGWCFTPRHFINMGSYDGVRAALSRLHRGKMIRRLSQGLYEYPRQHEVLGVLPPKIEEIAKAIAEKNGLKIQPSGAYAAHIVGLSTQVPGRVIFLTNGPTKRLNIGKLEIVFRSAREKTLYASGKVGLVIQALKNLGEPHIDTIAQARVKRFLKNIGQQEIKKNLKYAPQWVRKIVLNAMEIEK